MLEGEGREKHDDEPEGAEQQRGAEREEQDDEAGDEDGDGPSSVSVLAAVPLVNFRMLFCSNGWKVKLIVFPDAAR